MKTCFKCGECKCIDEFYKHSSMADGHLNKCKDCTKADVSNHRRNNLGRIQEYDRTRAKTEKRKAKALVSQTNRRRRNPAKYQARQAVASALRAQKLCKMPCVICGCEKTQAHHDDYAKPLDVEWLCFKCHRGHRHGQSILSRQDS